MTPITPAWKFVGAEQTQLTGSIAAGLGFDV